MVFILVLLAAIFLHHRHKLRKRQALSSIKSRTRQGPREGRGLLADEDFDFDDTPPAEFVDPFWMSVHRSQEVDLGRIVNDVMGPGPGERSRHTPSSSFSSGREADQSTEVGGHGTHYKTGSDGSYTGLLDEFGVRGQSQQSRASLMPTYSDPFDPPGEYSSTHNSATMYDSLPPGAANAVAQESRHNPIVITPGTYSLGGAAGGPSVAEGLAAWKPKKSSPLVRAISNASHKMGDTTRLWLHRKVKKEPADEDGSGGAGAEEAY
jgi:hypothetical protein